MKLPVFLILAGLVLSVGSAAAEPCTLGDVNDDGLSWSVADVVALQRHLANCDTLLVPDECANIDGCDGVDVADAVYFQQFLAGVKPNPILGIFTPDCGYAHDGDIISLELVHQPDLVGGDVTLAVGLYIRNSKPLAGASVGFNWDNLGLTLDSAVYPVWLDSIFDGHILLYECSDPAESVVNHRARLYAAAPYTAELNAAPIAVEPRLWATYYFSPDGWDVHDTVVFDTNSFSDGAMFKLVDEDSLGHVPEWGGALTVRDVSGCCGFFAGGYTGNTNCDINGRRNLSDISMLIDRVYVSKHPLCCEANGNVDGDVQRRINLADISRLIDHVYISKEQTAACP